jgi:hypothetical protein
MASQRSQNRMRPVVWALALIAAIASASALYLAFCVREARSQAATSAAELVLKERQLSEYRDELERLKRSAATSMEVAAPATSPTPSAIMPGESSTPPSILPFPTASPDPRAVFRGPAFRDMMRRSNFALVRPIYDPVLSQLNLTPEQRTRFYDLHFAATHPEENLDKLPGEAGTAEERAQIEAQLHQIQETASAQIQEMFGPRGYALYQNYKNTESDRINVQQFLNQVDSASLRITDWQYDRLIEVSSQARAQYPPTNGDITQVNEATIAQAAQFLTPDQLSAFRDYLNRQAEINRQVLRLLPTPH